MLKIIRETPKYDSGIEKDGEKLVLLPPSKKHYEEITELGEDLQKGSANESVKEMYRLLTLILNMNEAGVKVENDEVNTIDAGTALSIITEYLDFISVIDASPNSKSLMLRKTAKRT